MYNINIVLYMRILIKMGIFRFYCIGEIYGNIHKLKPSFLEFEKSVNETPFHPYKTLLSNTHTTTIKYGIKFEGTLMVCKYK